MLAHVSNNRCKDRSGLVSRSVLSKGRISAALEVERLSSVASEGQAGTRYGSVDQSTDGGVCVREEESLIDRVDDAMGALRASGNKSLIDNDTEGPTDHASRASGDDTDTETQRSRDWPRLSGSANGQTSQKSTVNGLDNLSIAGSNQTATTMGWTKALFPEAKPTPAIGGWTQPKAQSSLIGGGRRPFDDTASSSQFLARDRADKPIQSDWDRYVFERDPMGKYKCPVFQ